MLDVPLVILEVILIANIVILISITSRAWKVKKIRGSTTFAIMVLLTASISFFYLLEVASQDFEHKMFWLKLKHVSFAIVPGLALIFSLKYVAKNFQVPKWVYAILTIEPIFYLVNMWFEPFPGLYTLDGANLIHGTIDNVILGSGELYMIHLGYSALLIMASVFHFTLKMKKVDCREKGQYGVFIFAFSIPMTAALIENWYTIPEVYLDWPVFTLSISSVVIFLGFRSFNLFRIDPTPYTKVLDSLDEGVVVVDRNRFLQDVNPQAEELLGISENENIARQFKEIFPRWSHLMTWKTKDRSKKVEIFRDRDKKRTLLLRSSMIFDEKGRTTGYLFTSKDITEEEIYRLRLYRFNTLLDMINKILRHDLLNELLVMQVSVEKSIESGDVKILETALRSMQKSKETIKRMRILEIESMREEDLKSFKLSNVLKKLDDHTDLNIHIRGDAEVMADEGIYSVFNNLINNSVKHGKAVNVTLKIMEIPNIVKVIVQDDGVGIPPQIRDSIFREGITFGEDKGSGLGLFLVRRSMHRFGGTIKIDKSNGKGACFILTFFPNT